MKSKEDFSNALVEDFLSESANTFFGTRKQLEEMIAAFNDIAAELREKNINVNCVLPTIIDTPENRAAMPKANPAKWVAPADLANVIVFLASDAARAVHGAAVPVTSRS